MKIDENNITASYPLACHIDNKLSQPEGGEVLNAGPHHPSALQSLTSPLKYFWATYILLVLIDLANIIVAYTSSPDPKIFYIYLPLSAILLTTIAIAFRTPQQKSFGILFSISALHFIITDPSLYYTSSISQNTPLSSLQLLLPLTILFSNFLKNKPLTFLTSACAIISFCVLIPNPLEISYKLLQFSLLAITICYEFLISFNKKVKVSNKERLNVTPLEEIIAQLNNALDTIVQQGEQCAFCKNSLDCTSESVSGAIFRLQTCKNIYTPRLDKITMNMDEDDKAFIKQNALESSQSFSFNIETRNNRRTRSESALHVTKLGGLLKSIGKEWNFNTFFLKECTEGLPLEVSGLYIFSKFKLDSIFSLETIKLEYFLKDLEGKYLPNPYHNSCHGADVMNSYLFFLNSSEILAECTDIELIAGVLGTLGHDVGHPAKNNRFLIMTRDSLAIQYNDVSVLENLHCTILFQLIQSSNLLALLFYEQWCAFRKICIELILATDMSKHFDLLETFKTKYSGPADITKAETRLDLFKIIIKASDLGHAAKTIELHQKWCAQVIEEFYLQGDQEKALGLPVSMYCDRETTNIGKSQSGFIKNIVLPLYLSLNQVLSSELITKVCIVQLEENKNYWETLAKLSRNQTFTDEVFLQRTGIRRRSSVL